MKRLNVFHLTSLYAEIDLFEETKKCGGGARMKTALIGFNVPHVFKITYISEEDPYFHS